MKIQCIAENLATGLNLAGRVTGGKQTLPVLGNVLVKTEKGRIKLASTNLEIGISCWIGGKVEKEGEITVPARLFTDYLNSLKPDEKITLETEGDTLKFKNQNFKASLKGIPSSEFPLIPEVKGKVRVNIPTTTLKEGLRQVVFATAQDEVRPVLGGVFCNITKGELVLAATDSYRLAEKKIKLGKPASGEMAVIVPQRSIQELVRILEEEQEEIEIRVEENQILFKGTAFQLVSRLIEGSFPQYTQIIPEETEVKAKINTADFLSTVKTAGLFAREGQNAVRISINPQAKGQELEILASGAQAGEVTSNLAAKVEGKQTEISFNVKYLADALSAIRDQEISLELSGKLNPGVLRPNGSSDYIYVIMPIRSE